MSTATQCRVRWTRLRLGTTLKFPVHDDHEVLLLAAGQTINETFLEHLVKRGIDSVHVDPSELPRITAAEAQGAATEVLPDRSAGICPLETAESDRLDEQVIRGDLEVPFQDEPFAVHVPRPEQKPYSESLLGQMVDRRSQSVAQIQSVYRAATSGREMDVQAVSAIVDDLLTDFTKDCDLFTALGINPLSSEYPARHSLSVSSLAVGMGVRLRLDRPALRDLALGCLVHDAGMLRMPRRVYVEPKTLDQSEFVEITKHPVLILDALKNRRAVPDRAAMIAYQTHERSDGSGYPRRRNSAQIHMLSKIAAAADAYIGLVSPRPHRPALAPFFAVQKVLQDVRHGKFDGEVTRALLETVSLFPLGSFIQLSDGRVGRVIRSNPEAYTTPVAEVWDRARLHSPPEVVNLAASRLRIDGPLQDLDGTEVLRKRHIPKPEAPVQPAPDYTAILELTRKIMPGPGEVLVYPVESPESIVAGTIDSASGTWLVFTSTERLAGVEILIQFPSEAGGARTLAQIIGARPLSGGLIQYTAAFMRRLG